MSDQTVNVAICLDDKLLDASYVLLASIKANARRERPVTVYAITSFPTRPFDDLSAMMDCDHFELRALQAPETDLSLPIRDHITQGTYLRFLLPSILPHISRIVYLDVDTVVHHELETLFDIDLDGRALAAMPDHSMLVGSRTWPTFFIPYEGRHYRFEAYANQVLDLPCPTRTEYVNCGVMVLDLDVWRKEDIAAKTLAYLSRNGALYLMDQDALNHVVQGRAAPIDARWNCFAKNAGALTIADKVFRLTSAGRAWERVRTQWRLDPWIIHYAGANKPWAPSEPSTPQDAIWWRYALQSPLRSRLIAGYKAAEIIGRRGPSKMPRFAE